MSTRKYILAFGLASAALGEPPRDPRLLMKPREERAVHLSQARVLVADYEAIREDFPSLRPMSDRQIDAVLVSDAAFFTGSHAQMTHTNTPIPTDGKSMVAYRPQAYGRAIVLPFRDGLIESKGGGAIQPSRESHRTGIMTLGESLREFAFEKLVREILKHAGYPPLTVRTYAVMDPGFDALPVNTAATPAGIVLRQAHLRSDPTGNARTPEMEKLELLLRRYGITSNFDGLQYGWMTADRHNLQITRDGAVFDFGSFLVAPEFPNSPVQPDPALRVPLESWGYSQSGKAHPTQDGIRRHFDALALDWRAGRMKAADVQAAVDMAVRTAAPPVLQAAPDTCGFEKLAHTAH